MRHLGRPFAGWLLVSGPLILGLLSGCDSQSPSFVEKVTPLGSEDALGDTYSGEGANDPDAGITYDPARDDETAADKGEESQGPGIALAQWTFKSSSIEQGTLSLDKGAGQFEQRLQMANNRVPTQLDFQQTNRPVATETFAQGSVQANKSESFLQTASASGLLDILVVVDNSGSMKEEQVNLSSKMMPLLSYVQNSDWKIGVVTTDPNDGCLRGLIKKNDQNASQMFSAAVNAGIQGSGNERGIYQAVNGLKGECNTQGSWLRSNSTLAVLIVSDEDNCSNGEGCGNEPWARANYLLDYMASIRQVGVNARVYGLAWHPTKAQSACKTAYYKANIYADAVARSGGTWGSVCDADYTGTLQAISLDLSTILKTQFTVQAAPNAGTLKVYVDNQLQTSGYQLRGNVVEFSKAPQAGATIRFDYAVTTVEPKKEFVLSQAADPKTLTVYLDGVATQSFTYDAAQHSVKFTAAPAVNEIKTVFRKALPLESDFQLAGTVVPSSLKVTVNGQTLSSGGYSYNAVTGKLHLAQAPLDGLKIEVAYTVETAPKLRYAVNAAASQMARIHVVDAATQRAMTFAVDDREIVFPANEYRADRSFVVVFPLTEGAMKIDLGYPVLAASVRVEGTRSGSCPAITVTGSEVDLSDCSFVDDEGINIAFDYAGEHRTSFELGALDIDLSQYVWKVLVNGQEVKGFSVVDEKIELPDLPLFAQIEVSLYKK